MIGRSRHNRWPADISLREIACNQAKCSSYGCYCNACCVTLHTKTSHTRHAEDNNSAYTAPHARCAKLEHAEQVERTVDLQPKLHNSDGQWPIKRQWPIKTIYTTSSSKQSSVLVHHDQPNPAGFNLLLFQIHPAKHTFLLQAEALHYITRTQSLPGKAGTTFDRFDYWYTTLAYSVRFC